MALLLLSRGLLDREATAQLLRARGSLEVLVCASGSQGGWHEPEAKEVKSLPQWLQGFHNAGTLSPEVAILWGAPDEDLGDTLKTLSDAARQYEFRVGLFLCGPVSSRVELEPLRRFIPSSVQPGAKRERVLQSVWLVGREDVNGRPVDLTDRTQCTAGILQLLLTADPRALTAVGLFSEAIETPFCAVGLRSWGGRPTDYGEQLRRFAEIIIWRTEQEERQQPQARMRGEELTAKAGATIACAATLGLADAAAGLTDTGRISAWPATPANPFAGWRVPWTRQEAMLQASARIQAHFKCVLDCHTELRKQLKDLGRATRDESREVFRTECQRQSVWLRQHQSFADVALLLHSYFPAMPAARDELAERQKRPVEPASSPGPETCRARFVAEATALAESYQATLPTSRHYAILAISVLAGLSLSVILFSKVGVHLSWASIPALLTCAGATVWLLLTRATARRLLEALTAHFNTGHEWLAGAFRAKLDWVRAKTRSTLRFQLVAWHQAIGRRLQQVYDRFMRSESPLKDDAGRSGADRLRNLVDRLGVIEQFESRLPVAVRSAAPRLIEAALGNIDQTDVVDGLSAEVDALVARASATLSSRRVPVDEVRETFLECASDRRCPPILARLDAQIISQRLFRTFILPEGGDYDPLKSELANRWPPSSADVNQVLRLGLPAPMILVTRRSLSEAELETALSARAFAP